MKVGGKTVSSTMLRAAATEPPATPSRGRDIDSSIEERDLPPPFISLNLDSSVIVIVIIVIKYKYKYTNKI